MQKRFTKLDVASNELPDTAKEFVAVRDNAQELIWSAGEIGDGRMTWDAANNACAAFDLCGAPGRLPSVEELFALADRSRYRPAIDTDFFPTTKNDWYWTSTPDASAPGECAWVVPFYYGYSGIYYRYYRAFVRAVRSARASQ